MDYNDNTSISERDAEIARLREQLQTVAAVNGPLRDEPMQQARIISELSEELNTQDGEIKRLREVNANNLEGWQQNVAGLNREIARLREETEILRSDLDNRRGELAIKEQQIESLEGQLKASKSSHAGQTRNTLAFQSLAETRERERDEARVLLKEALDRADQINGVMGRTIEPWHQITDSEAISELHGITDNAEIVAWFQAARELS